MVFQNACGKAMHPDTFDAIIENLKNMQVDHYINHRYRGQSHEYAINCVEDSINYMGKDFTLQQRLRLFNEVKELIKS